MVKKKGYVILMILSIFIMSACFPQVVNAAQLAFYDPNPVSFYGQYNSPAYYFDGSTMGFNAKATASDGISRELIIEVFVSETNVTHRYRTYTDGVFRGIAGIPINGGSGASFKAYCSNSSVQVTLDLEMFS